MVKRRNKVKPPAAVHVLYRRIYGDSGYLRSTTRRRLRVVLRNGGMA